MEDYVQGCSASGNIEECIQDDIITVGLRNGVSGERPVIMRSCLQLDSKDT